MSSERYRKQVKLKTAISELALEYVTGQIDLTFDEYCEVYDAEAWERMLVRILKEIDEFTR